MPNTLNGLTIRYNSQQVKANSQLMPVLITPANTIAIIVCRTGFKKKSTEDAKSLLQEYYRPICLEPLKRQWDLWMNLGHHGGV